jgi:hypothetical protein
MSEFGLYDRDWSEQDWSRLLHHLVEQGYLGPHAWRDVTALVLGHLNPSQVGTGLASSDGFKRRYGKGNTMRVVMDWFYNQSGTCADCGTRLELQADHIQSRAEFDDPLDADFIENMTLRCRRCNVIRRPSHLLGGTTYLTAESALMWILLVIRPRNYRDFLRLCRLYGMTMADIRMQEAWAMAHWLSRSGYTGFQVAEDLTARYDLLFWPDGAVTRRFTGERNEGDPEPLYAGVKGEDYFGFVSQNPADEAIRYYQYSVDFIPFSTYDLGSRPRNDVALVYVPPDRQQGTPPKLLPLPPRGQRLLAHAVRGPERILRLRFSKQAGLIPTWKTENLPETEVRSGRKVQARDPDLDSFTLEVMDRH